MEKDRRAAAFRQAAGVLPPRLRALALALPEGEQGRAEELRLRAGRPMAVLLDGAERPLGEGPVEVEELERLLELASQSSVHAVLPQLRRGYLTMAGGHRIGLCGTAVLRAGELYCHRTVYYFKEEENLNRQ